jgi:hypothetical protein
MVSVNYVIATYPGKQCVSNRNNFVTHSIHPETYLRHHLEQLIKLPYDTITQITIMKATPAKGTPCWNNYYKIDDLIRKLQESRGITVVTHNVPNVGQSYGQYIKAYEMTHAQNFDYWILMEDDYIPLLPHFDNVLIRKYNNKAKTMSNLLLLCSWATKVATTKGVIAHHAAHSLSLVNEKTMSKVFNKDSIHKHYNSFCNSQCQMKFSLLFTKYNIKILDYTDLYSTPFWNGKSCVNCSKSPKNNSAIFSPLQSMSLPIESFVNDFSTMPKHSWINGTKIVINDSKNKLKTKNNSKNNQTKNKTKNKIKNVSINKKRKMDKSKDEISKPKNRFVAKAKLVYFKKIYQLENT